MGQKYLITSALPYVNGELHIGHLVGCWLPSDVYARFCRAQGRDVLYVCGADEHGTPYCWRSKRKHAYIGIQ
ncbi:MAG: class I tRNA ligase family protein [Alphaproteobacteria bacterium]|nr:class I tRNA ligase family protein [Alphaproteobacteria bacterium]